MFPNQPATSAPAQSENAHAVGSRPAWWSPVGAFVVLVSILLPIHFSTGQAAAQPADPPALVLGIAVDQFRYDYLTRFRDEYTGGLKRLLEEGAVFTNANYRSAPTETAVGHGTFMTGATPSVSGIVGNAWYDRDEGRTVESITDSTVTVLGGQGGGASPRRLLVSTIPDELKLSGRGGKVFGVSLKNRSAILPAGHMADGAFWSDGRGHMVSSTYYFDQLPDWAAKFNASEPVRAFAEQTWVGGTMPAESDPALFRRLDASPWGDELVHQFALTVLDAEQLGTHAGVTDMLLVSYSSTDYVGHQLGPDSPEIHAMALDVDRLIGDLLDAAERQAGAGNVLVAFTADHGVAPVPETNQARRMPGGRVDTRAMFESVEQAIKDEFGFGNFIESISGNSVYFRADPIPGKEVNRSAMERTAAEALRAQPHVARVYTRSELLAGSGGDLIEQRIRNGFQARRSPDLVIVLEPYWLGGGGGTTHGSPYAYDTHVPVIFFGMADSIRPGAYHEMVGVDDIAPTLATLLGIATPSGATGNVLTQMLK